LSPDASESFASPFVTLGDDPVGTDIKKLREVMPIDCLDSKYHVYER
jgi:hypothetical protein